MVDIHAAIRRLAPGQSLTRKNVEICRLENGDLSFKLDVAIAGQRDRSALGRESDGMTLRRAQEIAAERKAAMRRNVGLAQAPATDGPRLPFRKAAEAYLAGQAETGAKNLHRKTFHLRERLIPYFGERAIGLLNEEMLLAYRQQRREAKASDSLINRELATLSHALGWMAAGTRKWLPKGHCPIPWTREEQQWREVLTAEERKRLLQTAVGDIDPHCFLFVAFLLNTPMRHSEVVRVRFEHIDWDRGLISVPRAKAGPRAQPATAELLAVLAEARKMAADPNGWIFPNRRPSFAKQPHVVSLRWPFRRAVIAAKLDPRRVTPHLCRHTATTMLAGLGVGTFVLQQITGHRTARIVEHYVHLHGPQIREAAAHLGLGLRKSPEIPPAGPGCPAVLPRTAAQVIAFPKKTG
jgi:integrase